jgi:hypothetical protein
MPSPKSADRRRRALSLLTVGTLVASLLTVVTAVTVVPGAAETTEADTVSAAADPVAEPTSVTVAGSLQSELGCPGDWQADCAATTLTLDVASRSHLGSFVVPAGSWAFKIALNGTWDENYGAGGVENGLDIPLVLEGAATVEFGYEPVSHRASLRPTGTPPVSDQENAALAGNSLREDLTREQFYFV